MMAKFSHLFYGVTVLVLAGLACAAGAANTLVSGACVFRLDDVAKLLARIEFRVLE
jgi:hypothetical protein